MDKSFKPMYNHLKFYDIFQRRFSLLPPVSIIGFLPGKTNRICQTFESVNFSFILKGSGNYILRGISYPVKAPCIITQWPGEPMDYGPSESWDEMFFIYKSSSFERFVNAGLLLPDSRHPVRILSDAAAIQEKTERLEAELVKSIQDGDAVDMMCYDLILTSWTRPQAAASEDPRLVIIHRRLKSSLGNDIDCRVLAEECGMSLASLRRFWESHHPGESFMKYRNSYFLRRSYELLAGSPMSIKEISQTIGFSDQYYFSRKFHQLAGMSPLEYRHRYAAKRQ